MSKRLEIIENWQFMLLQRLSNANARIKERRAVEFMQTLSKKKRILLLKYHITPAQKKQGTLNSSNNIFNLSNALYLAQLKDSNGYPVVIQLPFESFNRP